MSLENPYRAAGAFSGKAYIRRDADAELIEQIEDNQYYPYFAAPRQSGKSSLLLRTMAALDNKRYRCALVDLSPFVVSSYDDFWRQFLHEVARSANFDPAPIGQEDPRDVLLLWLASCNQRLIVFMDEIDVLLSVDFREQIFSKFRTFFNLRARLDTASLQRLQFVFAGAAHSSRFIKDPRWSPFNVAIEIELEDLTPAQVTQLAAYLGTAGSFAGPDLTARVFELSGGSVFLCQLIFEQLWNQAARGKQRLGAADVDSVVATIVAESPRNIHFYNIFRLVTADARLTMLFRRLTEGQELGQEEAKELRLTGICRGANPFRNEIYARVFGPGGPLDLKVGDRQIQLTKALDGAIARRDSLQGDPRAEPRAIAAAEAEIRRLRKEFREGTQLQAGDVLGRGRYRLEERIGQGGFAGVWRATDLRDQSDVAIKVLHGQFAEDKSRRERFFRGAWKMSELQHPAIVRVLEPYGDENGQFYFVMEYLPGGTLHAAVQDMQVTAEVALKMLAQVGQALHFAHERGLVHRDVKPSNVMIDGERGKLTDFDLVRETDITGGTRTGAMGTFIYAAPEVMSRPQDADVRADIYGLGMTVVFALYGADLAMDVIRDADRFIDRLPCNAVLKDVLKKSVAWDRNDRFTSAAEFVAALERASEVEVDRVVPAASEKLAAREVVALGDDWDDDEFAGPAPAASERAAAPVPVAAPVTVAARPSGDAPRSASAPARPPPPGSAAPPASAAGPSSAPARPAAAPAGRAGEAKTSEQPARQAVSGYDDGDDRGSPAANAVAPVMLAGVGRRSEIARSRPESADLELADAPPAAVSLAEAARATGARTNEPVPGGRLRASAGPPPPAATPAMPESRSGSGLSLAIALTGLAAALLLVLFLPRLLWPEDATSGMELTARVEHAQQPTQVQPPLHPELVLPGPGDPRSGSPTEAVGEASGALRVDPALTEPTSRGSEPTPVTDTTGEPIPTADPTNPAVSESGKSSDAVADPPDHNGARPPTIRVSEQIDEGCALVRGGDAKLGVEVLLKAHDRKPGDMRLLLCLADGHSKLENFQGAANFYERVLEKSSRHRIALLGAAQAYEAMNHRAAARVFYQQLLDQEPGNVSARAFFAEEAALARTP
ncbi:MAG TPA: protein kinase [Nannocystis sp.]|jgi:hypothetical protein